MPPLYGPQADFALTLQRLLARGEGPLVWSPYSVASALGLVAAGANGPTRSEITDLIAPDVALDDLAGVLHAASRLQEPDQDAPEGRASSAEPHTGRARRSGVGTDGGSGRDHSAVRDGGRGNGPEGGPRGGSDMAVTNTLWVRPDLPPLPAYERTLTAWPGAGVHTTDFEGDVEGSRRRINAEVEKVTHGLITELLRRGDLDPRTVAVLVNALWVKLVWQRPFAPELTKALPFQTPAGARDVPTMQRTGTMRYGAVGGWQMLSLPGAGGLTLDVLLADAADEPPVAPDARTLNRLYDATAGREVRLFLPRFEVRSALELRPTLAELGVRQVFTDQADLTGITDASLQVDEVIHQAVLRADEAGAEGAAATAVTMRLTSFRPPEPPLEFRVDRPFLVILRNAGAILFLARVTNPNHIP